MMKFCRFDYVHETNTCAKFGCIPPAGGRSTHTWNIHFLWLFLPSCLFFSCAPAQAKRIEIISRTMAQKTQFGVRKCPPSKCFSLIWRFGGHIAPKPPNVRSPIGKSQPITKSRMTSKPFKIDKKCQLNMNIKSLGRPFRIRNQKLPEAPPSDEIAMTSFPANMKS